MTNYTDTKNLLTRITLLAVAVLLPAGLAQADTVRRPGLIKPRKDLFSHAYHLPKFEAMGVQCTDCHSFSIKPRTSGPTAMPVKEKYLRQVVPGVCHQCHLGRPAAALRKGCLLCHQDLSVIKPQSHYDNWRMRHGKFSEMDRDACTQCHPSHDCTSCHAKQNTLAQLVHRPNFRLSHSIQARSDPQSCTFCHKSAAFCMDCHSGSKR